jgi:hypothetical protein
VASFVYAVAVTPRGPDAGYGAAVFADNFGVAAFACFLVLLVISFASGPLRIDMTMMGTPATAVRRPRAMLRLLTDGKVDLSHRSFPLQILAGLAAVSIVIVGLFVSAVF